MLKAIFFDLDGTLLPLNEDEFIKVYFKELSKKLYPLGYETKELIDVVWNGTMAMGKNDGSKLNIDVFWDTFKNNYGEEKLKDKDIIDSFYTEEFRKTKEVCGENKLAKEIVKYCKDKGLLVVLSTNPIFPRIGTLTRMSYVDLKENDFDYITSYENSKYCKPNPKYFIELLNQFNLKPEEVIVFGNNTLEDGDASNAAGMKCYLVGDYIIYNPKAKNEYPHINMDEVIKIIDENLK